MARILYLGNSLRQFQALPDEVRKAVDWALDELAPAPNIPPIDSVRGIHTTALEGPESLFRIAVRRGGRDPGYRIIYSVERDRILLIRVARRDAATYAGLKNALRLLRSRRNDEIEGDRIGRRC